MENLKFCFALLLLLAAAPLRAQTIVYGQVLSSEPVFAGAAQDAQALCEIEPPPESAGLMTRLRWDLEERALLMQRCEDAREPSGYIVRYRWNGRIFTQELPFDPGERIALRLDVH
ncbi:MAG: hypothetical protein AAF648_01455 [Pseudomonadota bacterium]